MAEFYEIRKDVPFPSEEKSGICAVIRRMSYGDSIVIPAEQQMGVHTSARSVGAKVKTQSNGDGTVTVWRIDHPDRTVPPVVPGYPEIERTTANPELGLLAGYYIQEGPYSPRVWIEGEPPAASAKKDIFS